MIVMDYSENRTINMIKGIACIAVVFIHVSFPGKCGQVISALSRAGVAVFFVISGYFLYCSDKTEILDRLPMKIVRTAKMITNAMMIYFVWESFVRYIGGGVEKVIDWYATELFTIKSIVKMVLISYDPVVGHLWFLIALFEGYLLFFFFLKRGKEIHWIFALSILELHIILMAISNIYSLNWNMNIFRSVWFYGFPFIILGYWIKKKSNILKKLNTQLLCCMVLFGIILTLIECFYIGTLQIYNGSLVTLFAIYVLTLKYPNASKNNIFVIIGAKYSSQIYVYHWITRELLIKLQAELCFINNWFNWLSPFFAFICTLLFVYVETMLCDILKKKIEYSHRRKPLN